MELWPALIDLDYRFYWCYTKVEESGFSLDNNKNIARHRTETRKRPAL